MSHCFLCARHHHLDEAFEKVSECKMPASKKSAQVVLQHLANCIKTKLYFQQGACICPECIDELGQYDILMVNLLAFQKKLTHQLQVVLTTKIELEEEDTEFTDIAIEFADEGQLADALNPELDTKEELIEVDEHMIEDDTNDTVVNDIVEGDSDGGENVDDEDWVSKKRLRDKQECVVCGTTFKTKLQLQSHISAVHNAKTFSCNICGAVRRDEEYLELHMNIHEGKTENECRYCPKRFSRPVNTLRHMRKHWDRKKYQCEKCGERFSLDNMLYNHRLRHEAEENPLICSICNQSFKSRKTYNHHMLVHQENRPRHHCTLCSKSFTERYTLKMHMKTHGDIKTQTVLHEEQHVEAEAAVTALVNTVNDSSNRIHSCVICSTQFESKELLEQHLQRDHDVILK